MRITPVPAGVLAQLQRFETSLMEIASSAGLYFPDLSFCLPVRLWKTRRRGTHHPALLACSLYEFGCIVGVEAFDGGHVDVLRFLPPFRADPSFGVSFPPFLLVRARNHRTRTCKMHHSLGAMFRRLGSLWVTRDPVGGEIVNHDCRSALRDAGIGEHLVGYFVAVLTVLAQTELVAGHLVTEVLGFRLRLQDASDLSGNASAVGFSATPCTLRTQG